MLFLLLTIPVGCLEPYQPPEIKNDIDIIVIDGFINATDLSATVKLSYATALTSQSAPPKILNANVTIEDNTGGSFLLNGDGNGSYHLENIAINFENTYRLLVAVGANAAYASEYISITRTPPIDSVRWVPETDGFTMALSTHDPEQHSGYYRWTYEETWEHRASFYSTYKMVNGEAIQRTGDDQIFTCWSTNFSTEILLGSSVRLAEDVIRDFPITFVPGNSGKLESRYSIQVEQRTLTREGYEFWLQLQKTTESLGGLFDPQPAQVLGNIKNSGNSGEPVLGYFSGGQVSRHRIFIRFQDLPKEILTLNFNKPCKEEDKEFIPLSEIPETPNSVLLIDPIYAPGVGLIGYTTALSRCIDCQLDGGVTIRPDYW